MKRWRSCALVVALASASVLRAALGDTPAVTFEPTANAFPLATSGVAASLVIASDEWPGVTRAVRNLQDDIAHVSSTKPELNNAPAGKTIVLIGTLGHSALLDDLVRRGKFDARAIAGKWEASIRETVADPFPGVAQALVIAGSDKRGTIYGVYDLAEQIGVSPWAWWADVPVPRHPELFVTTERHVEPGPVVKYRGIFLNDEAPALTGWAKEKFGGLNAKFYEHVFELLLRLRGNLLWPAMWNNAFNEDDPENPRLADEMGIVMSTSHHEPMLRAQQEWKRHGSGPWDYAKNGDTLRGFWADGVRRNRAYESIVTLAMRGDGDEPMSEEANVALLERIVADQRKILATEVNADLTRIPQVWALYKEVQGYYEKGMRVPDDVTLLWCDDNWGNLRRLPTAEERTRSGGAGVYYHFDYVGGPRNYKWLNTVPLTKISEQMNLAWQYDATRLWIVNVGDLKPMEFSIEFFLRLAWNPGRWPYEKLREFSEAWVTREFGEENAREIAALVNGYTELNGRRKPEMLAPDTFSLVNYCEAEGVLAEWRQLKTRAEAMAVTLSPARQVAFFQLVQHPIEACTIVNELQIAAGQNRLYAAQGRASTNTMATRVRELFAADAALQQRWDKLKDGKWRHLMDQTHLGYTSWQQPVRNVMPAVSEIQVPEVGELAVAVEGDPAARPGDYPVSGVGVLPPISPYDPKPRWFEVFNRGQGAVRFTVEASAPWLKISKANGELGPDQRVDVSVDWPAVPGDVREAKITVRSDVGATQTIRVPIERRTQAIGAGFVESDKVVAIEAQHFSRAVTASGIEWRVLPDFGRTLGRVTAYPVTHGPIIPGGDSPRLEYDVNLFTAGEVGVELHCAPSLDFQPGEGLRLAISFDDAPPQVVKLDTMANNANWERAVGDGIRRVLTRHRVETAGRHVLKIWFVTPGVVLERAIVDCGGLRPSYLGPPESVINHETHE